MSETKIYHLVRTAPRVKMIRSLEDGGKVPIEVHPNYQLPNVYRVRDKQGRSVTFRYLSDCDEIDQAKQIELKFLANQKFTSRDREDLMMVNGVIETNKLNLKLFLDSIPGNENFEGDRGDYPILFKEYVPETARATNLALGLRQAEAMIAANKFTDDVLDLKLLQLFGSSYELPLERSSKMEALMAQINLEEDEKGTILNTILGDAGEDTNTLVGRAINAKVLSLTQKPNQVSIMRNGQWNDLTMVSDQHTAEQRMDMFLDRLQTTEGQSMIVAIKHAFAGTSPAFTTEENNSGKEAEVEEKAVDLTKLSDDEFAAEFDRRKDLLRSRREEESKIQEAADKVIADKEAADKKAADKSKKAV